jgi:multidrug resistance efflux pump
MPFHQPNKLKPLKGRSFHWKRVWHYWPLVVWLGVLYCAIWAYGQGVVFRRMNGAVDVYQENVSPHKDGNLDRIAEGIERGKPVKEGEIVAYMSTRELEDEMMVVKSEIDIERQDRLRDYDQDLLKIQSDLLKIDIDAGGAAEELKADQQYVSDLEQQQADMRKQLNIPDKDTQGLPKFRDPRIAEYGAKIAKLTGQIRVWKAERDKVQAKYDEILNLRKNLEALSIEKEADILKMASQSQASRYQEIKQEKERMTLRATRSGTVDRILKEPGEYVKAGEGVLKIVGYPTQIVGFLPEDQLSQISIGKQVWITSTLNRARAYKSKVLYLAPRMNSLADSTSPLPNKRVHGRDVICEYPPECVKAGDPPIYDLLSGQTIIIHLEKPGSIPLLNRIFHNDDMGLGAE